MNTLVVIPCRAGSKRIPRKNWVTVGGVPLWKRAYDEAKKGPWEVVVSTDDEDILEVCSDALLRPAELCTDTTESEDVMRHILDVYARGGAEVSWVVLWQCTSPFTRWHDVERAVEFAETNDCVSVFSAVRRRVYPWVWSGHGGIYTQTVGGPRCSGAAPFVETGAFYAVRVDAFRRKFRRSPQPTIPYEVADSTDIDTWEDLYEARRKATEWKLPRKPRLLALDFDGVMTDNRVYVDPYGVKGVECNRSDGHGLAQLRGVGFPVIVVSRGTEDYIATRCDHLGIPAMLGTYDKLARLREYCDAARIEAKDVVFVGNDTPDLLAMRWAGLGICPSDAHPTVVEEAEVVLPEGGGAGAVRLVCDKILEALNA